MWPSYCENAKNRSFPVGALSICSAARGVIWEFLNTFLFSAPTNFRSLRKAGIWLCLVVRNTWLCPFFQFLHCICVLSCCSLCRPLSLLFTVAAILGCQCWSFLNVLPDGMASVQAAMLSWRCLWHVRDALIWDIYIIHCPVFSRWRHHLTGIWSFAYISMFRGMC